MTLSGSERGKNMRLISKSVNKNNDRKNKKVRAIISNFSAQVVVQVGQRLAGECDRLVPMDLRTIAANAS